jgi:hypothetical protein
MEGLSMGPCPCPECDFAVPRPRRCHDDGDEYQCPECGEFFVRHQGDPRYLVIFPGDIAFMIDNDIEPLWPVGQRPGPPDGRSPWCVS